MVHPNTILESLRTVCNDTSLLPEYVTYSTVELDAESEHANIPLPVIEFVVDEIDRNTSRNTDRVGTEYDESGNEIGYIFQSWFDARFYATVITASRGDGNHRTLDQKLRTMLYQFDDHGLQERPPHPHEEGTVSGINTFRVGSIKPIKDFNTSPTMRARQITLEIKYVHEYFTTDIHGEYDYVEDAAIIGQDSEDDEDSSSG